MSGRASLLRVFLALLGGWTAAFSAIGITPSDLHEERAGVTEEGAAAARYISNLKTVVATQIVPSLERGILSAATSRPRTLTVEVTDDPSPYTVGARLTPDGSLIVRLSLGYTTMHDAALDAAGIAAALNRERGLREYLTYQLRVAHENHARRARHEPTRRVMTFAEFAGLDPKTMKSLFVQPDWRARRERVQVESLGWVVSYLLIEADPRLAGMPQPATIHRGEGAARLAASSGWFPVPPFATAFGLSAIDRPVATLLNERALLCRAALLMQAGFAVTRADTQWRARLEQDRSLQGELAEIQQQIDRMRRDGRCTSSLVTASSTRTSTALDSPPSRGVRHRVRLQVQITAVARRRPACRPCSAAGIAGCRSVARSSRD